jgi:hypothetical protein
MLFWVAREDVGFARITWRVGADGSRGYELLAGTDPVRAPRGLNRWGYIAEEVRNGEGSMLALLMGSADGTDDTQASAERDGPSAPEFHAVRSGMRRGAAAWQATRIFTPAAFTIHDVDAALRRVDQEMNVTPWREAPQRIGPRPGFLTAVAEAIGEAVATDPARSVTHRGIPFVFGRDIYELTVDEASATAVPYAGSMVPAIRLALESRAAATGARSQFTLVCGRAGDLAGVPLMVSWQPRWWLKATLTLSD